MQEALARWVWAGRYWRACAFEAACRGEVAEGTSVEAGFGRCRNSRIWVFVLDEMPCGVGEGSL